MSQDPFTHSALRPYAWKTDEFRTETESRPTVALPERSGTEQFHANASNGHTHLTYQPHQIAQNFRCPNCMSNLMPRLEKRISTAGWVTFSLLLVFFFPLFWIGLLIKEEVPVCQSCNTKLA